MADDRYEELEEELERRADHEVRVPSQPAQSGWLARDDHDPDYSEEGEIPTGMSGKRPKTEKR